MLNIFRILVAAAVPALAQGISVNLRGIVTDSAGAPVAGAMVKLENHGATATSAPDGSFVLSGDGVAIRDRQGALAEPLASVRGGRLALTLSRNTEVTVTVSDLEGRKLSFLRRELASGSYSLPLAELGTGPRLLQVEADGRRTALRAYSLAGVLSAEAATADESAEAGTGASRAALAKPSAAVLHDVLTAAKAGYQKAYVAISNSDSGDIRIKMLKEGAAKFSFFVTSMRTLQQLAKSQNGFGGDLRFGETGPGAGLRGADKICAAIAEISLPGSSVKGWRAFLSVTADAYGKQVDAIDRVGPGPWYDRTGRVLALAKADLLNVRPVNADPAIQVDLPNEFGVPNKRPDPSAPEEDNHHMITGTHTDGKLRSATHTCKDWTSAEASAGKPGAGLAWPRGGTVNPSGSGSHWMAMLELPGCVAGIEIVESGGPKPGANIIGAGGGYGGFYCFALNP